MAVHKRPAAFEGVDGAAYSVDILTDTTGDPSAPWGAYLFFLRWGHGEPEAVAHLETDFLARGFSEVAVRDALARMSLLVVKATLDGLIRGGTGARDAAERTTPERDTSAHDAPAHDAPGHGTWEHEA
jgi:hypothetical protein